MVRSVKHFSLGNGGFAAGTCAILFAMSVSLAPVLAQGQDNGSLEDMWQESQDEKPAPAAATPKTSSKKSSKKTSKKPKTEEKTVSTETEGDLTQSQKEAAPGWGSDSGSTSTSSTSASTPKSSSSSDTSTTSASSSKATEASQTGSSWGTPSSAITTPASSASSSTSRSTDLSTGATAPAAPDTEVAKLDGLTAPLCKFSALTGSDFIKTGGWPGVGPFAQDKTEGDALVDEAKNKLKVKLSGEDVTHAELLLVNQPPKPNQLLAVQMTADFLLEAVGAQSGKIADFNSALLQNQEKLSSGEDATVNLKAGTYVVQIQKKPAQDATVPGNVAYLIALDNSKAPVVASAATPKVDNTNFSIFTPNAGSQASSNTTPTTISNPSKTAPSSNSATASSTAKSTTPSTTKTTIASKPPTEDLLHRQFSNLINNWQQIKRSAVKTRQSDSLSRILGGKALSTQNNAIQWLLDNKKFYEMTPLELKIVTYREVTPGSKYEVDTYIKERRQLMNANTMKAEKDSTSAYNVVYTVEKIRGSWLITDTRMSAQQ